MFTDVNQAENPEAGQAAEHRQEKPYWDEPEEVKDEVQEPLGQMLGHRVHLQHQGHEGQDEQERDETRGEPQQQRRVLRAVEHGVKELVKTAEKLVDHEPEGHDGHQGNDIENKKKGIQGNLLESGNGDNVEQQKIENDRSKSKNLPIVIRPHG